MYDKSFKHYELDIQVRKLFFFWITVDWMTVQEGFVSAFDSSQTVLKTTYASGNSAEAWKDGTLDLYSRAKKFIDAYRLNILKEKEFRERIEE